jgi:hypothetical protein
MQTNFFEHDGHWRTESASPASAPVAHQRKANLASLQTTVLAEFRRAGAAGLTDEQLRAIFEDRGETRLGPTIRARRCALRDISEIVGSGCKRKGASGAPHIIWVCSEFATTAEQPQ